MNLLDSSISIGDGAIYSVFGLVFVMLGISLLVLIFMLFGFGMKKWNVNRSNAISSSGGSEKYNAERKERSYAQFYHHSGRKTV